MSVGNNIFYNKVVYRISWLQLLWQSDITALLNLKRFNQINITIICITVQALALLFELSRTSAITGLQSILFCMELCWSYHRAIAALNNLCKVIKFKPELYRHRITNNMQRDNCTIAITFNNKRGSTREHLFRFKQIFFDFLMDCHGEHICSILHQTQIFT